MTKIYNYTYRTIEERGNYMIQECKPRFSNLMDNPQFALWNRAFRSYVTRDGDIALFQKKADAINMAEYLLKESSLDDIIDISDELEYERV